VTGIFGPNGAGKTTLLHAIAGLLRPDAGRIELDGRTLFDAARDVSLPPHGRRVGVVFQEPRLFPHLSVRRNLEYGLAGLPAGERRFRPGDVVGLLGLSELLGRRPAELSGGERQRVALGRAILSSPRLLLLDEPLAGLDRRHRRDVLPFLSRVREVLEVPTLHVSHDLSEILRLSRTLMILDAGRVAAYGPYADVALDRRVMAGDIDLLNVLEMTIEARDQDAGLLSLRFAGEAAARPAGAAAGGPASFVLRGPVPAEPPASPVGEAIGGPAEEKAPGAAGARSVTISIRPQDIALAAHPIDAISIQNQLPGVITRLTRVGGHALVEVDVGTTILASVSSRTVEEMALGPGTPTYCLIKVNAITYLD
jgi:molybdate transport system ATP-binding protein